MRIESRFLHSAVARRVFWALLAAAILPLLLFAALAYGTLSDRLETQAKGRLHEAAKYAGLRVYDRLLSAQTALAALAVVAQDHGIDDGPSATLPPSLRKVFRSVISVDVRTGQVRGPADLADAWRRVAPGRRDGSSPSPHGLWWLDAASAGTREARVMLGHRDSRHWWVGELAPEYLWGDLRDPAAWASTCVTDQHGHVLLCADGTPRGEAGSDARGWVRASWSLFTRADFGAVDWVFVRRAPRADLAFGELPVEPMLLKAAAFSALLVAGLGLVLVRRTTVPLEQLMEGTRRLARREWSARVRVDTRDEFGQLAGAFNDMAGRVQRQMHALQVQSGIDREILTSLDVPRALGLVLARLKGVVPGSPVGLLLASDDGPTWRLQTAVDAGPVAVPVDPDLLRCVRNGATRLQGAEARCVANWLDGPAGPAVAGLAEAGVHVFPARTDERLRALLLLRGPVSLDVETAAEIEGLADRLAVILMAAARERELRDRAIHDSLTGLTNRAGLIEVLDRRLSDADPQRSTFVLACIDLDGFKAVNDAHGHPVGDALLSEVAALLREQAPEADLVARLGGDEFVLLLPGLRQAADALAARLCDRLARPFVVGGLTLRIGASVGLVHCPDDGRDHVELMRRADLAMYAGKAAGRGRHAWFEPALDERAAERAWLQTELPGAMQRNELCLHFQPRVRAGSRRLASVEALLRWPHPTRGMVSPARIVPMAEETGQMEGLGRWVLEAACRQHRLWRDQGVPVPRISVNVSAQQLAVEGFAGEVLSMLRRHGLHPTDLELELTESLFAGDTDHVAAQLSPLRDAGVQVALDDFGTGFSSLSSLHRLPVDVLKIDRSFVTDLGRRESADAVARSIVALARALGKHVVAEGVETQQQLDHLMALGCDELQGYLFARPLPPTQVADWLQQAVEAA